MITFETQEKFEEAVLQVLKDHLTIQTGLYHNTVALLVDDKLLSEDYITYND